MSPSPVVMHRSWIESSQSFKKENIFDNLLKWDFLFFFFVCLAISFLLALVIWFEVYSQERAISYLTLFGNTLTIEIIVLNKLRASLLYVLFILFIILTCPRQIISLVAAVTSGGIRIAFFSYRFICYICLKEREGKRYPTCTDSLPGLDQPKPRARRFWVSVRCRCLHCRQWLYLCAAELALCFPLSKASLGSRFVLLMPLYGLTWHGFADVQHQVLFGLSLHW